MSRIDGREFFKLAAAIGATEIENYSFDVVPRR